MFFRSARPPGNEIFKAIATREPPGFFLLLQDEQNKQRGWLQQPPEQVTVEFQHLQARCRPTRPVGDRRDDIFKIFNPDEKRLPPLARAAAGRAPLTLLLVATGLVAGVMPAVAETWACRRPVPPPAPALASAQADQKPLDDWRRAPSLTLRKRCRYRAPKPDVAQAAQKAAALAATWRGPPSRRGTTKKRRTCALRARAELKKDSYDSARSYYKAPTSPPTTPGSRPWAMRHPTKAGRRVYAALPRPPRASR